MTADSLTDYVRDLSPERREPFLTLTGQVARRVAANTDAVNPDAPEPVTALTFIPGMPHPVFSDSDAVIWAAATQLGLDTSGELPLAFLGYDVQTRISGRRESQGFLVTDRRLIVKDDVDGIFGKAAARQYPLFVGPTGIAASAAQIGAEAARSYNWDGASSLLEPTQIARLTQTLVSILTVVLEGLDGLGVAQPSAPVTATDLRGRVRELGLASVVKYDDDPKERKHFAKLAKKMPLEAGERVIAAFTASTIAGPYGLVLTSLGIRSRDLGEAPVFTPMSLVDPDQVRLSGATANQLIVAPGQVHELPSSLTPVQAAALEQLVTEWARGELSA